MRRVTVALPDELAARLEEVARLNRSSISAVVRRALEVHLGLGGRRLIGAKAGRSGHRDTARRIEEILRAASRRERRPRPGDVPPETEPQRPNTGVRRNSSSSRHRRSGNGGANETSSSRTGPGIPS
ncbi:MAG TPA: ribbon-helix-helix protein, CopG family [Actinomycetota bacterium]|nr:ribbon-helix-helix protein, CopG family [Actinomycetota bacterium]